MGVLGYVGGIGRCWGVCVCVCVSVWVCEGLLGSRFKAR